MRRIALAGLVALAVGIAIGRWSAPTQTVTVDERAEETVTAVATTTSSATETAVVTAAAETDRQEERVIYRDRWYRIDGSLERESEVESSQAIERRTEQSAGHVHREEQEARVEIVEVMRIEERRVEVTTPAPDWRASALVGLEVRGGELVYGAQLERRILGPISVGAWGLSSGAAGVSAGFAW